QRRNETHLNEPGSRLHKRNEANFNDPNRRLQRRNEALGDHENRYQRRHISRHDLDARYQRRGEEETSKYRRGYEASQNDRANRYQRRDNTFESRQSGRCHENDSFRNVQEGRYQRRYFAHQTGQGSRYQIDDTLQKDRDTRYQGRNDAFFSHQNDRYEGENRAYRSDHRTSPSYRRDRNSRYQGRYQASQSEYNIIYERHGSPRRDQNNRQEREAASSQSDQTVRHQGRYEFSQSNQIGRCQTQDVFRIEMNITQERKDEESQNYSYCRYQKANETSGRKPDGRHVKDEGFRIDSSDKYQNRNEDSQNNREGQFQKRNEDFRSHLKIVDQAQEMVKYSQHVSELLPTEIGDNNRPFAHRYSTEYPDQKSGVIITDRLRTIARRIVSSKIVKMVGHTEAVKKHPRGTISPPQKRYAKWTTPRAVKAKGVHITGIRSAVVRYSCAERIPEEKTENKPRRQTWPLQIELDSQMKSSKESQRGVVENPYTKRTVPEMTQFPNRRSTVSAAHPIELMDGHSSETFPQQTNFPYKRSREQETHDIHFANKCIKTSTTMSSRTLEGERKVQQRGSFFSDSLPTYRSNSACYMDMQPKIECQQVGPSVHHKDNIASKQLKGSMQNSGSVMDKVPKEMASYNEKHERTNSGSSSTSYTWFNKKFRRGLASPKEIDTDRYSRIPVPTDSKVLKQKTNRVVHDIGCRQRQIPLSHDPRLIPYPIRSPRDTLPQKRCSMDQPPLNKKDTECRTRTQVQSELKDVQIGYRELEPQQERVGNVRPSAVLPPPERPVEYCRREQRPPNAGILGRLLQESRSRNFQNNRRRRDAARPQHKYFKYCCMYTNESP
ncbi:ATP-dependent DNA helicase, partial [Trichonephila inaurata madagascariensis]